eukprot:gene3133-13146_t
MPPRRPKRLNRAETSLICLIQALEGRKVVAELRNDCVIRGKIDSVDDYMNITLSDASYQTLEGTKTEFEFMYLKGRTIRFVHLPKSLDPAQAIEAQRKKLVEDRKEQIKERLRNQHHKIAKGIGPSEDHDSAEGS